MSKIKVGDMFPDFTVNTVAKEDITISQLADNKPLMLWVLRYIGCTTCRYDVHLLITRYEEFVKKGVNVAIVMQSTPQNVRNDLEKTGESLPFELICDPEQIIYKSLDIEAPEVKVALEGEYMDRYKAKKEKIAELGIVHGLYEGNENQLPAFFFLDKDMTVKVAHYAQNGMDMPTIDDMLNMI